MTESSAPEPFISPELRPTVIPRLASTPPLAVDVDVESMRTHCLEMLGISEELWQFLYRYTDDDESWKQSFTRSPDVTWNTLDEETVLLNVKTSRYYTINRIATWIWELIEPGHTLAYIADKLYEKYEVPEEDAKRDLLFYIRQLHAEGLIEKKA